MSQGKPCIDDEKTISERIIEIRKEAETRIHYWDSAGKCSVCGVTKSTFAATRPCNGAP
jgi:hypothetical protein